MFSRKAKALDGFARVKTLEPALVFGCIAMFIADLPPRASVDLL